MKTIIVVAISTLLSHYAFGQSVLRGFSTGSYGVGGRGKAYSAIEDNGWGMLCIRGVRRPAGGTPCKTTTTLVMLPKAMRKAALGQWLTDQHTAHSAKWKPSGIKIIQHIEKNQYLAKLGDETILAILKSDALVDDAERQAVLVDARTSYDYTTVLGSTARVRILVETTPPPAPKLGSDDFLKHLRDCDDFTIYRSVSVLCPGCAGDMRARSECHTCSGSGKISIKLDITISGVK